MTISIGDRVPEANLLRFGADGPETVSLSKRLAGRKVVVFGMPGAFTRTCSAAHLPSFIRTKPDFDAKGVEELICITVNDPFVVAAWADTTGAAEAGLTLLADADGGFTKEIGMDMTVPAIGFFGRARRFAMVVEDGVVTHLMQETEATACDLTTGESLLAQM